MDLATDNLKPRRGGVAVVPAGSDGEAMDPDGALAKDLMDRTFAWLAGFCEQEYRRAYGEMQTEQADWIRYWQQFSGRYRPHMEGPFADTFTCKIRPRVEAYAREVVKLSIPDPCKLDFFRLDQIDPKAMDDPEAQDYHKRVGTAIRQALAESDGMDIFNRAAIDLGVMGNCVAVMQWEYRERDAVERRELPEFLELSALPDEELVPMGVARDAEGDLFASDPETGRIVEVERYETVTTTVAEEDRPTLQYLSPLCVVPSELDQGGGIDDCERVYIWAPCAVEDFPPDTMNMDVVRRAARTQVQMMAGGSFLGMAGDNERAMPSAPGNTSLLRVPRVIVYGVIPWESEECPLTTADEDVRLNAIAMMSGVCGFNEAEFQDRIHKAWHIELPEDGTISRLHPVSGTNGKKPIVHHRMHVSANRTWGQGLYIAEMLSRVWNRYFRLRLITVDNVCRPGGELNVQVINQKMLLLNDGKPVAAPGKLIERAPGAPPNVKAVEYTVYPTEGIQAAAEGMAQMEREIEEQTQVPSMVVGQAAGRLSATESQNIQAKGNEFLLQQASAFAHGFLGPVVQGMGDLFKTFVDNERTATFLGSDGRPETYQIPGDAFRSKLLIVITGPGTLASREMQRGQFRDFAEFAMSKGGVANMAELVLGYAEIIEVPTPKRYLAPPPDHGEPVPSRNTFAATVNGKDAGPFAMVSIMRHQGIRMGPSAIIGMFLQNKINSGLPLSPEEIDQFNKATTDAITQAIAEAQEEIAPQGPENRGLAGDKGRQAPPPMLPDMSPQHMADALQVAPGGVAPPAQIAPPPGNPGITEG